MFQCFETPDMGPGIFTFFCFSLFRTFRTIESVDLEIFCLFHFVSVVIYYIIYMFQCFETPDMGPGIFTFFCFSLFRNVSKQLKVWT